MADKLRATAPIVDDDGRPTRVLFVLLDELIEATNVTIPALEQRIIDLEALVASHHP